MCINNYSGTIKRSVRLRALHTPKMDNPSKVSVFYPSKEQLCVKEALNLGVINTGTFIIAIENDKDTIPFIRKGMKKLGFREGKNLYIHEGETVSFKNLEEVLNGRKIDYAFLDFCGELSIGLLHWIDYMMNFTKIGSYVGVTANILGRGIKGDRPIFKAAAHRRHEGMYQMMKKNNNCSIIDTNDKKEEGSTWLLWAASCISKRTTIVQHTRYQDKTQPMCMTQLLVEGDKWGNPADSDLLLEWFEEQNKFPYGSKKHKKHKKPTSKVTTPKWFNGSPQKWSWDERNPNSIRKNKRNKAA